MNKYFLALATLLLTVTLGVGAFFMIGKNNNPTPAAQTQTAEEKTSPSPEPESGAIKEETNIEINANGFLPKEISIKKGDKVVWTNNSGKAATVDSTPHPVHTSFPEMNLGSFNDGQTLEFTFNRPGTYNYHNHFIASQTGSITVE